MNSVLSLNILIRAAVFHLDGLSGAFFSADSAAFAVFQVYIKGKLPRNNAVRTIQPAQEAVFAVCALVMVDLRSLGPPITRFAGFSRSRCRYCSNGFVVFCIGHWDLSLTKMFLSTSFSVSRDGESDGIRKHSFFSGVTSSHACSGPGSKNRVEAARPSVTEAELG